MLLLFLLYPFFTRPNSFILKYSLFRLYIYRMYRVISGFIVSDERIKSQPSHRCEFVELAQYTSIHHEEFQSVFA